MNPEFRDRNLETDTTETELKDIRSLGEHKPMGYLPIETILERTNQPVEKEAAIAEQRGYVPIILKQGESNIGYGCALFVYHEPSLSNLLEKNKTILEQNNWPISCDSFVRRVATEHVSTTNTELYDLIAEAFGDKFRAADFKNENEE